MQQYALRDVERLLQMTRGAVLGLVRAGFVTPVRGRRGEYRFSFQDLIVLRTAGALTAARVPTRRITRALRALQRYLAELGAALRPSHPGNGRSGRRAGRRPALAGGLRSVSAGARRARDRRRSLRAGAGTAWPGRKRRGVVPARMAVGGGVCRTSSRGLRAGAGARFDPLRREDQPRPVAASFRSVCPRRTGVPRGSATLRQRRRCCCSTWAFSWTTWGAPTRPSRRTSRR